MTNVSMRYAVVRKWKDNPNDFQVLEYVATIQDGDNLIKKQNKSSEYEYEVMEYA